MQYSNLFFQTFQAAFIIENIIRAPESGITPKLG